MTVHKVFGKDHGNVLQKIDNIIEDIEDSGEDSECLDWLKFEPIYFIEGAYRDDRNRMRREYLLTKDGFTLFGHDDAMDFKLASLCLLMLRII